MRHLPPPLFWVTGVPASVGWWHFQLCFHPSEKWMTWQERYQMSCRASQWICHWVWLLPEWIVIYLYGSLVMLTDLLPGSPRPQCGVDRLSRSFGGSVGEVWQMWFGTLLNNSTPAFDLTYPSLHCFYSWLHVLNQYHMAPPLIDAELMLPWVHCCICVCLYVVGGRVHVFVSSVIVQKSDIRFTF